MTTKANVFTEKQLMSHQIPVDFLPFVQRMVAARRFLSEDDVLAEGLRLLQARETLRDEVQKGFHQLDEGLGVGANEAFDRIANRIESQKSTGQ